MKHFYETLGEGSFPRSERRHKSGRPPAATRKQHQHVASEEKNGKVKRALAVHQPFAEQFFLAPPKSKTSEYRSRPTAVRETVYVYACKKMTGRDMKECEELGLDPQELPRGVIIGTIEIVGCKWNGEEYEWKVSNARKFDRLMKPQYPPYGGAFFNPGKLTPLGR